MVILHKKYTKEPQPENKDDSSIMSKFPEPVRSSFSETQIKAIIKVSRENNWKRHPIDIRFTLPFFSKRFYVVFIAGRSRRESRRLKNKVLRKLEILLISLFLTSLLFMLIALLYLIKSALGIDIFSDMSLGIWDGIKDWISSLFN